MSHGKRFFRPIALVFFVSGLFFSQSFLASAQERIVRLKDGTIFRGKVLSKDKNSYKIENNILGVIAVKDSDILSIEEAAPAAPSALNNLQQKIAGDPHTIQSIQSLAQDQEVVEILSDPQLKAAIMRQDVDYLKNTEKFLKFTNNPSVKKIISDVTTAQEKPKNQ